MKNLLLIILLFLCVGAGWHFYGETVMERVDIGEVKEFPLLIGKDVLLVRDQVDDGVVEIDRMTLSGEGFVVIQADEGGPGRVLGHSGPFEPGRRRGVEVVLDGMAGSGYAFASLYRDDGDGVFNIENDIPARGPSLAPVQVRFLLATPPAEDGAEEEPATEQE